MNTSHLVLAYLALLSGITISSSSTFARAETRPDSTQTHSATEQMRPLSNTGEALSEAVSRAEQMSSILSGNATDSSSTATLVKLAVAGCTGLTIIQIGIHAPSTSFYGTYTPTLAKMLVSQAQFSDIRTQIAGGNTIPVTLTLENNVVKSFCYGTTCISS